MVRERKRGSRRRRGKKEEGKVENLFSQQLLHLTELGELSEKPLIFLTLFLSAFVARSSCINIQITCSRRRG